MDRIAAKMEECLAALAATGHTERALSVGTFLVDLAPTRESVHRALMSLHAERGDRAAALRQYARCREQLARHLDVIPEEATESLKRALAENAAEAPAAPSYRAEDERIQLVLFPFEASTEDDLAKVVALGLTEDLRTELTRFRKLAVMAWRPSSDGARPPPARLTFQGTVRVAGDRTRVTASLMDAGTGLTLWAERWESPRDDAFTVLDRLTRSVAGALALKIDEAELARARRTPRDRLKAYESWLRGMDCMKRGTPEADAEARDYFERSLEASPDFARAHAGISLTHFNDWSCQAWDRWDFVEFQRRRMDLAIAVLERVPDCLVDTRAFLAAACALSGMPEPAREHLARFHDHFRKKITPGRDFEPGEPLKWILHVNPFRFESDAEHLVRGLAGAGINDPAASAPAASP